MAIDSDIQQTVEKTPSDSFGEELQALLKKYPNIRLTVNHQISINDIGVMANEKPHGN